MTSLWWLLLTTISLFVCYQDITKRTISNRVVFLVMSLCSILYFQHSVFESVLYAVGILFVGFVLFNLNIIAAGDVKLLSAFSLAITPQYLPLTLFIITLLGSLLGVAYYLYAKCSDYKKIMGNGLPYGVPICLGCLFGIAASL
ncbi:prepilin peptidase [Vibrio cortegadensis]|uniref:A24 family peptidase n=1 Tax=Vibrio cortegadensis TaxID=1328770 RepID=UPI0021C362F6|nr:prepilin peptidase [Vibrio cortegadensis]MDN3698531.1 prepilin peptidase [Vibrio cortegadensis]